ncbi:MAG: hypothetical protein HY721_28600 [Planctomycetes bacterium]|nr:hypothetical protein [Planctomycetota bacterium]
MTYEVLVKRQQHTFTATVLNLPNCTAEAPTREEAIEQARTAATRMIAEGEIVRIDVGGARSAVPLSSFAGMWRDDETFDEFSAAMAEYRRRVDADAAKP